MLNPLLQNLEMHIDIDDSGPLDPFPVNCNFIGIFQLIILSIDIRVMLLHLHTISHCCKVSRK